MENWFFWLMGGILIGLIYLGFWGYALYKTSKRSQWGWFWAILVTGLFTGIIGLVVLIFYFSGVKVGREKRRRR